MKYLAGYFWIKNYVEFPVKKALHANDAHSHEKKKYDTMNQTGLGGEKKYADDSGSR